MRIGFIDSGVGGLSILAAVRAKVPAHYIYVMDNQYLPYGEKSEAFIQARLAQLSALLVEQGAELIVIACNTATTQAVASLRQQFEVPFVGTVPAIKPAAAKYCQSGFTVMATPATCRSSYLRGLITEFAPDCVVETAGSSELVRLAELKVWYQQDVSSAVAAELSRLGLQQQPPAALVLGCTHFPFLTAELAACLPDTVFLDTADAIARRVQALATVGGNVTHASEEYRHSYISSGALDERQRVRVTELGFDQYQHWSKPATTI
ncbi:MAG: glutamate racemase [Rheinheimera sp.]|nr:MAG: glutamate racemase [Rheinheimera sp.]